jgi:hypothetical protein
MILTFHPIRMRGEFSFIIGLPSIQAHRLASKCQSVFQNQKYNHNKYFQPLSEYKYSESMSWDQGQTRLTEENSVAGSDQIGEIVGQRTCLSSPN